MDIQVSNLSKRYGPQRAVDNISFEVKTGEILGFLGPNGAGKSTTMKMITGFLGIEEGEIIIGGTPLEQADIGLKKHIGYLPENNPLYLEMPVIDYLIFCAKLQDMEKNLIRERVIEMVKVCGLNAEKHKKIGELSKGFRQRVGLAQAMIHDPEILILDEPTTGLDPNQIVEIRSLIRELGKEKTVILSTHILPEVEATCDRIMIINNGKIVADGTTSSLRDQARDQTIIGLEIKGGESRKIIEELSKLNKISEVKNMDEKNNEFKVVSGSNEMLPEEIFHLCVKNKWIITKMIPRETKLEDIFRELTTN
jgi:gliding motility-associated transport system ATP-binding protein